MNRGDGHNGFFSAALCAGLKVLVTGWICGLGSAVYLPMGLGGAAVVPGLTGSYDVFLIALSLSPDILLVYFLSSRIPSRLKPDASLRMPRRASRARWAFSQCAALVFSVFAYECLSAILLYATALLTSDGFGVNADIVAAAICVVLSGLFCSAWVLAANFFALRREPLVGYAAVTGAHISVLLCLNKLPGETARVAARFLISARGVPAWHDEVCKLWALAPDVSAKMSPVASMGLLFFLSIALCGAITHSIQSRDLM